MQDGGKEAVECWWSEASLTRKDCVVEGAAEEPWMCGRVTLNNIKTLIKP